MKLKIYVILMAILASASAQTSWASTSINIQEALSMNLVSVEIKGTTVKERKPGESGHYGECIQLTVTNKTNRQLNLTIPAGQLLNSTDTGVQIMIVTKDHSIPLANKQQLSTKVYAMCSQKKKKAPTEFSSFTVGNMAQKELKSMATFIGSKHYQTNAGQQAMWALTDGISIAHFKDSEVKEKKELFQTYERILKEKKEIVSHKIHFQTNFKDEGIISIKIFDQYSNLKQILLPNSDVEKGLMNYTFWVNSSDFQSGTYTAILFFNGKAIQQEEFSF
jgi:hypothetical protein